MKLKRGDTVLVISGNDRGESGTVQRVIPKANRVVISGVNMVKKHQKPVQTGGRSKTQPGIIEFEAPIECLQRASSSAPVVMSLLVSVMLCNDGAKSASASSAMRSLNSRCSEQSQPP